MEIFQGSKSEDHGISMMKRTDTKVFSIGISTGGIAEIRMVQHNPNRIVVATTIDKEGLKDAEEYIKNLGLSAQICLSLQDIKKPIPYQKGYFNYVYARLVLHYLSKRELDKALLEIFRVLKKDGKFFIVVRSNQTPDATREGIIYDPETGFTHGEVFDKEKNRSYKYTRCFHSEESIAEHVKGAGFKIVHSKSYYELLFKDFMRREPANEKDHVIEILATK